MELSVEQKALIKQLADQIDKEENFNQKKPQRINKIYLNWKKLVKDLKKKYPERKVTAPKIADFMYDGEKASVNTKRKRFYCKASEFYPESEFSLTEIVNLCSYSGMTIHDFLTKYTKSV